MHRLFYSEKKNPRIPLGYEPGWEPEPVWVLRRKEFETLYISRSLERAIPTQRLKGVMKEKLHAF
jgi:hypothetical protein